MNLIRTSAFSAVAVATKLATSILLNKVLAVYVGPTGYGVIGQLQSLVQVATTLASGGVSNGVTKLTSEYSADRARQRTVWATAAALGGACTALPVLVLLIAHEPLARWFLGHTEHSAALVWLGLTLPLLVLNGLLLAILNGQKAVRALVIANIGGSLVGGCLAIGLVLTGGLSGALIALVTGQAIACFWTAWLAARSGRFRLRDLLGSFDRRVARSLAAYALMAATSAIVVPASHMIIRDQWASRAGWEVVGHWQALWKISETHLLLLTSTLSIYFLPRYAEIANGIELRREVLGGYRFVVPVALVSAALLFVFRHPLVAALLSPQFAPVADALGIQLVGDVLKIGSWLMAFTMVSHTLTRTFVISEVAFSLLFVALCLGLTPRFGLEGAAMAYAVTYAIYWLVVSQIFTALANRLRGPPASAAATIPGADA